MPDLQHKRGTRAALNTLAGSNGLRVGQVYVITDENRLAIATSTSAYTAVALQSEADVPFAHTLPMTLTSGTFVTGSVVNATALTTVALAANQLNFTPFMPNRTTVINELAIEVTTLIAASQARIGIYSATADGQPNALLSGAGTLLDCSTTGVKTSAVTPLTLTAGTIYWLACLSSSTQTIRGVPVGAMAALASPGSGVNQNNMRRATFTFGALPTTAPVAALTSSTAPWIRLRIN